MNEINNNMTQRRNGSARMAKDRVFEWICISAAGCAVLLLVVLLVSILWSGSGRLGFAFINSFNSSTNPHEAGIKPALIGSLWLLFICAVTAIPLGVGTGILLEEYQPKQRLLAKIHGFVQTNITNLAGVPSIVYGILGVSAFAAMDLFGVPGSMNNPLFTIGQDWYYEYTDLADNHYYTQGVAPTYLKEEVEVAGKTVKMYVDQTEGVFPPAAAGMTFYKTIALDEIAEVQILSPEELQPLKQRMAQDMDMIESSVRDGIKSARTSRSGPVAIDDTLASEIATTAFLQTNLKANTDDLIAITKAELLKMDGMEGRDLRRARRDLVNALEKAELKATGASGLMIAGSLPQRRDDKAWYYMQLPFGRSILAGGLTLMLVILPIIIVAAQEAIRAVPQSMRHGCLALGGTKWQAIAKVVLPSAIPGICTGSILAMSRAIGEAAPIILMGAVLITYLPQNMMSQFSAMPLQIYQWTSEPDDAFRRTAAAGIIVLLAVLLTFNAIAIYIRQRTQKQLN